MRKSIIKVITGCAALLLLFSGKNAIQVKAENITQAKVESIIKADTGKAYQIDLDQDGTTEKVILKQKEISEELGGFYYGILYVNGKNVYETSKLDYGFELTMNFVTCGERVFINLRQNTDNDIMLFNRILSYQDDTMTELVDFKKEEPGMRSCYLKKATANKLTVECEAQPNQLGSVMWNAIYQIDNNEITLKSAVHKVKSGMENRSVATLVTNKKLTFTDRVGSKTKAFSLTAGKKVKLVSITTRKSGKIFACVKYGDKIGYLRVDPYYNKACFQHVYEYLAG